MTIEEENHHGFSPRLLMVQLSYLLSKDKSHKNKDAQVKTQ